MAHYSLIHEFEDAPLLSVGGATAAYVSGRAEVAYCDAGEWTLDGLSVELDGERGKPRVLNVDPIEGGAEHGLIWRMVVKAIGPQIEEAVAVALAEDGIVLTGLDADNRLSAAQLGLGRLMAAE